MNDTDVSVLRATKPIGAHLGIIGEVAPSREYRKTPAHTEQPFAHIYLATLCINFQQKTK